MGLSKSKPKPRKDEEQKRTSSYSVPKAKAMEKVSQESKLADKEASNQPADNMPGSGMSKNLKATVSLEDKPDVKQKTSKKKIVIPQIIITRASTETLVSYDPSGSEEEQRTIREQTGWGPYYRHRDPSTILAYEPDTRE